MVRAFSLTSESLRYFIGYTMLRSDRVYIVSPWVSDVTLRFPVNDQIDARRMQLVEAVDALPETKITFIVREGEEHNEFVEERLSDSVSYIRCEDLHAKLVVCDEFVYLGSANITRGGLSLNREVCEVIENEYRDGAAYIENEVEISLPDEES